MAGNSPLLAGQSGIWFVQQSAPKSAAYMVAEYVELPGDIDLDRLTEAVAAAAGEAEVLHTRYGVDGERPYQRVERAPGKVSRVEVADHDAALAWMRAERAEPVDLATGPVYAQALLRVGGDRCYWYLRCHHVALDAYGFSLLQRRAAEIYTACEAGRWPGPTPFGSVDELVAEERAYTESPDHEDDRVFWSESPGVDVEPSDVDGQLRDPLEQHETLGTADVAALDDRAAQANAVWPEALMAAVAAFDYRYHNVDTVALGVPMMARTTAVAKRTPAPVVNVLPLALQPDPQWTVTELVAAATTELRRVRRHQRYRAEELRRDRGLSTGPLYGPLVNIKPPATTLRFGEHLGRARPLATGPIGDWSVTGRREDDGTMALTFGANPMRYDTAALQTLAARFTVFLHRLLNGTSRLNELDVLLPDERRWLAPAAAPAPPRDTLLDRFAASVARDPHRRAVSDTERALDYGELDRLSNRLANRLHNLGIGRGDIVALCLPRTVELIVGILGVLKSGAAYLPVDPGYPNERRRLMIADAEPALVLDELGELDAFPDIPPASGPLPEDSAYVIYTSGSTGEPKGVVVTQHNVVRLLDVTRERFHFGPEDVWPLLHSYAFDFSVWEIWGAFAHGGELLVVPGEDVRVPARLLRLLDEAGVTVLNQTPSAFYQFAEAERAYGKLARLRLVIFGGEALEPARLVDWFARHPDNDPELYNMYGITETTVHVTWHRVRAADGPASVIGAPLPDLHVSVLDRFGCPVPPGVVGQMHVSGPGVAGGYLRRPELTAQRFPANSLGPAGTRRYVTGDLARWTGNGVLEYLGRDDEQVQIRGHRIEPGEVSAAALQVDGVADAAVLVDAEPRLLCYLVPEPGAGLTPDGVRTQLASVLPEYALPAACVVLERFPLTPNGKLDRTALPAPEGSGQAATTPTEQVLCGLFDEVLGVSGTGPGDDFFALGGHSLLVTRLLSRVRAVLDAELDIRTVFTEPSPERLARRLEPANRPRLVRARRPARIELSPAQQRLWFLNRVEGPGATYNLPLMFELSGPVDLDALTSALTDLRDRHECLRTTFPAAEGKPYQHIVAAGTAHAELSIVDCDTAAAVDAELAQAARRGFDLAHEAPIRATLVRGAGRTVLLVCLHHIAGDDWSLRPLADDLGTAYASRVDGRAPDWHEPPVQYADYALWQGRLLYAIAEGDLAYWRGALAELPEGIDLPTDRSRPAEASNRGARVPLSINADLHRRVRELAAEHRVSVFMVLHAALAALLSRFGAGEDIPIGAPIAARTDANLHGLIGFFVNTLVLRTDLSGDPEFTTLLARVRDTDLAAYAHQETPFERVVEAVNPVRTPDRHPLFQVMLSLGEVERSWQWTPELTVHSQPVHTGTEKFDLTVNLVRDEGGGIDGAFEYATDLFDEPTVRRLVDGFTRLLNGITDEPHRRLSAVDILGLRERQELLELSHGPSEPITERTLPEMIEDQVRRTPDATAVVFEGITLSFDALNCRANQLATRLRELGVRAETTVGIHLPRSAEQIVALLAVLKAGGAFVPLESSWPAERVSRIAGSAEVAAVLSDSSVAASLPPLAAPVVEVDTAELDGYKTQNLPRYAGMDELAYVIYTSGSTGAPKGAMLRHISVSNRLPWQVNLLELTNDDAVLYKAPLSFDISVNEIFLPLVSGARLVVAEPGGERDVAYLLELIAAQRITFIYLVSTMLELMLERPEVTESARSLRHVWCGGEVLTPQLHERFARGMDATMYHGYGPAETTIGVTCQRYYGHDPSNGITIGRPNPNNRVYVLDAAMNPVPIGVAGQLYVGGVQLARGYLGDPERTAERFVADPFTACPGERLYATGDFARLRPDGNIEFLGRADNQVKIRGMRVEPEEIEAILARHPSVRQAAVVVRGEELVIYCVPQGDARPNGKALREWLVARVPEHMVPAACAVLDEFPLMPSGKVDRTALPEIRPQRVRTSEYVAPRTELEQAITRIWSHMLDVPEVGLHDNFFDLGGHSLLLARVQTTLQRELGHSISMLDLLVHSTPETLAARLAGQGATAGGHALGILLPIRAEGSSAPLFCVHPASGLGWAFSGLRKHIGEDVPVYAVQARGLDEPRPVAASLDEMAAEYVEHVRTVAPHGPYRLIGWSFGGLVAQAMATRLQAAGEEVALLGMLDSYPVYPWEKLANDHEQQALRSLLYMSHYDLESLPDTPLDRTVVRRIVTEQGGVLAELSESSITTVMNTFVNAAPLQQQATYRVFGGDLLFFTATVNPIDDTLGSTDWTPYVDGRIENVDVACEHKDMCQSGPLAIIGKTIDAELDR